MNKVTLDNNNIDVNNNQVPPQSNAVTNDPASNLFYFDDMPIFTLFNAMFAISTAVENLLGDQTQLISNQMSVSADLVGPSSIRWSNFFEQVLDYDEANIKQSAPNAGELAIWTNQFSIDNTKSSASATAFGNISSMESQSISSMTSNYQNLVQLAQTVVTGLWSAISQNWVI